MMADDLRASETMRLMELAADCVDWRDNNARRDPERALLAQALRLRRALSPDGLTARVLSAVPIRCRIDAVEFEERSQRYVVRFTAKARPGDGEAPKQEHVRSQRVDGWDGKRWADLCESLQPGQEAIVYKVTEDMGRDRKVRILAWAEVLH